MAVRQRRAAGITVTLFVVAAAACGSSTKSTSTTATTSVAATAAGGATTVAGATTTAVGSTVGAGSTAATPAATAASCTLKSAPLVVGLYEIQGESGVAVNSFDFGSRLAIKAINAAGGVCGQQMKYDRTAPSISDVQVANAAFLAAVDKKPTAMVGIPAPNELAGLQAQIEKAGIPTLSTSGAADSAFFGAQGVSQYNWKLGNPDRFYVKETVDFAVTKLGMKNLALMATTDLAPSTMDVAKDLVTAAGGKVTVALPYSPTANDLTPQILQVKGSDALIDYCYPNTCAVQLNQFQQNGINIPTITSSSLTYVANVLVKGPAMANAYAVFNGCVVSPDSTRPGIADFYKAYKAEYKEEPNSGALQTYNAMFIIKKAIEIAGTTDAKAVNDAMAKVTLTPTDGAICEDNIHADGAQYFFHSVIVAKYSSDGSSKEVDRITTPDTPKAA